MLTSADLSRCLTHPERHVRDHALRSLALVGERSDVQAEAALAVLQERGMQAFGDPLLIAQLPAGDAAIEQAFAGAAGSAAVMRQVSTAMLLELPQQQLLQKRAKVSGLPTGDLRQRLVARLRMAEASPEELWKQLGTATGSDLHDLILALVPHDASIAPLLISAVARNAANPGETAAIELIGRTRMASAVNALVDRLSRPEPDIAAAAERALGRIGTAGAVTVLEQRCNLGSATPAFRLHAVRAMGRFRVLSVEATLFRLLMEEDDQGVLRALCRALTDICTSSGFARLSEIVNSGKCGEQTAELKEAVAALDLMLKAHASRPVAANTRPAAAKPAPTPPSTAAPLLNTVAMGGSGFGPMEDEGVQGAPAADDLPLMEIPDAPPPAPAPGPSGVTRLRRDTAQVGRNDPCPCGSGKKYKKCCGQ